LTAFEQACSDKKWQPIEESITLDLRAEIGTLSSFAVPRILEDNDLGVTWSVYCGTADTSLINAPSYLRIKSESDVKDLIEIDLLSYKGPAFTVSFLVV